VSGPAGERPDEIAARVARFNRTRHARDLWPDVPVATFRAAETELGRVAAAVLGGAAGPVALNAGAGARALGVAAFSEGVGPLLGYWCETGRVTAEPALADLLAVHLAHGRRRVARLRGELERVLVAMAARGITVWVLKGMHTAYRYFPEPGTRPATDIDLLVAPDDWAAARDVLAGHGLTEKRHPTQPRDSAWEPPGARTVPSLSHVHADEPWSIDLHRSLDRMPFEGLETALGTPPPAAGEMWEEYVRPVRVLAQPYLLAYLALHASSHFYGMTQLRLLELALVARRDLGRDAGRWAGFVDLVLRTGSGRFVFPALELARRFVPDAIDAAALETIAGAAPRRLRRLVGRMTPATAQRLHPYPSLRERFVWLATPREALAALGWLVWPRDDEENLVPPARAIPAQWRRVRRAVRRIVLALTPR
jgi:hypothetical protein